MREHAHTHGMERAAVRFTRRAVRTALGLSDTPLRLHLERLVNMDYIAVHGGKMGQSFTYSVLFDGDDKTDAPQMMGLTEASTKKIATEKPPTSLGSAPHLTKQNAHLARGLLADNRGIASPSLVPENTRSASTEGPRASLLTASSQKPPSRSMKTSRLNGNASPLVTR